VAARAPVELVLAGIWSEVLQLDCIGVHDNFLELGGDSLLATQVISRVRKALHAELPMRAIFETPTVAGLAAQIAEVQAKKAAPEEKVAASSLIS